MASATNGGKTMASCRMHMDKDKSSGISHLPNLLKGGILA
uniref:Uncharacterized protein n=1 Tax=Rhizophora mucronata TaxID=61149 RepID=A0A2P2JBZ4_RHIMU